MSRLVDEAARARAAEVVRFARASGLRGYQRITLPDGTVIPGWDRKPVADLVFPARLDGRTVLDIGCDYGFFLHDAVARGAIRAVGVEREGSTHAVAERIASLWDGRIEIRRGSFEDLAFDETFDLVLCLNVIHHSAEPWAILDRAAAFCRGTLAVEFPLPSGVQFWCDALGRAESILHEGPRPLRAIRRLRHELYGRAFARLTRRLPLIGVGSKARSRTFYFNEAGFRNAFTVHHPICHRIEFRDSPSGARERRIALCDLGEGSRLLSSCV